MEKTQNDCWCLLLLSPLQPLKFLFSLFCFFFPMSRGPASAVALIISFLAFQSSFLSLGLGPSLCNPYPCNSILAKDVYISTADALTLCTKARMHHFQWVITLRSLGISPLALLAKTWTLLDDRNLCATIRLQSLTSDAQPEVYCRLCLRLCSAADVCRGLVFGSMGLINSGMSFSTTVILSTKMKLTFASFKTNNL